MAFKKIYYVIVDDQTQELIDSYMWYNHCDDALKKLRASGDGRSYSWFNITHPKCPAWAKALIPESKENTSIKTKNQIKFTKGFYPGIMDTHPLTDASDGYYCNTEFGLLIIDGEGVCLHTADTSYYQETQLDSVSAKFIVDGLELLKADQIQTWAELFKQKSITCN